MLMTSVFSSSFLLEQNPAFKDWSMDSFTVDILDQITALDLEEYEEYLKVYQLATKPKPTVNVD